MARAVIEGEAASAYRTVTQARQLLHDGDAALAALASDLADGLIGGHADVRCDRPSRLLYATDASIYEMEPVAVLFPRALADVQHAVAVARDHGVPLLPRGGGTSLAGQGVNHAIVLDFTVHMDRALEIDPARRLARVQPGVVLSELNKALRPHDLHYPIDPSTANRATIGGGIGNNSCGTHSALYGKTQDVVESVQAVLSDATPASFALRQGAALEEALARPGFEGDLYRGVRRIVDRHHAEIEDRFPRILRRVSGYNLDAFLDARSMDLTQLLVGSEGTLAITTEATLRLASLPAARGIVAAHFDSLVHAAEATLAANTHAPAAVELIDAIIIDRCRRSPGYASLAEFVEGEPKAVLLIELFADDEDALGDKLAALEADLRARGMGYAFVTTTDAEVQARMWGMRQAGLGLLMSMKGDPKPVAFVEDTAVAPERLPAFVARFDETVRSHGLTAGYYGHASVGCLHIRPVVNLKDADGLATAELLAGQIADLVVEFGGSLSGEHGDGIVRGAFIERMFGPRLLDAFREVKGLFDPEGLLNPGKIVDTPAFADNLRLSPSTTNLQPPTYLNFDADGGLARAAEQCNGQGTCRKFDGGMCPSFMVTKDEEHSTRGRANLLRHVLNGALPASELTGERVHSALDLCVECKACKAECPSAVDMAKLKYEILTQYHEAHGLPLRARAFGHINTLARWGSRAAPLANVLGRSWPARQLLHRTVGIHRERRLPRFAGEPFERWFARHEPPDAATRGDAIYFDDTFTNYFHPEVGIAAVRVLEALGYRVKRVSQRACCGRPAISKGMLPTARRWAAANIEALRPFAEDGVPIVGTEPSCLLTLRDEYPDLVGGPAAESVAGRALMLEELLAGLLDDGLEAGEIFRPGDRPPVVLHGHCHQKAIAGMDATLRALRAAGYDVDLIDSGCCGMAGSFGFEAEHYDISRAMGAYRLFPAIEAADAGAIIAITGASCRQQIDDFTDRSPRHAVELLADALGRSAR